MARSLKAVLAALTIALGWPSHAPAQDCSVDMSANPSTIYVGQQSTLGVSLAPPNYTPLGCLVSPTANPCGTLKWCVKPTVTTTYSAWCSFRRPTGTTCYASDSTTVSVIATPKPKVSLSVDRPMVADGDPTNVTLSWTVSGATSATLCTASGAWSGSKSAANGSEFIAPPTKTSTYTLSCTEAKPASTTVQVFGVPQNLGSVVNRSGDELAVSINRKSPNTMLLLGYRAPGGNGDIYQAIYDPNTDRWSAPSALPAPVNSTGHEHSASNQGNQLVLSGWRTQGATNVDLFQSLWVSNKFTTPTVLSNNVSTSANESYPFIAAGGSELFFASDRPGGAGSYDIYQSTPTASGWGNVTRLGSPISSSASDISPSLSKDGSTLFFSSARGGNFDVYYAKKKGSGWDTPIAFGAPFNTLSAEQSPALTDDGTRLYFVSNRNGGYGGLDLYVSVRK